MDEKWKKLEKETGLVFHDASSLSEAFVHRSFLNESKRRIQSNERLEFLGDSILSSIVSDHLFRTFPDKPEGYLTNLRSTLVRTETLASIAVKLNLGAFLSLSKGEEESGGRQNPSLLADTFEAFLGAVYLDQGLQSVRTLLSRTLFPLIAEVVREKSIKDAKSRFQECVQEREKASPEYVLLHEEGPDHSKLFTIGVNVQGVLWGKGTGKTKQDAEQQAAATALEKWEGRQYNTPQWQQKSDSHE